jgi:hypothetical protein
VTNGGFEVLLPDGRPADWELLGDARVETGQAHGGQRALRLVRTPETRGEVGLNRAWKPNSGEQGTMLAALRGGIRFWYRAVSARPGNALTFQIIPMTKHPVEVGGTRVVWRVPAIHIGDGQWHEGRVAYDLRDVAGAQWIHVAARVLGTEGELWLDDIDWVSEVGPVIQVGELTLRETPGREGENAVLTAPLLNLGDRPASGVRCVLEVPNGLQATGGPAEAVAIAAGGRLALSWTLTGARNPTDQCLRVRAATADQVTSAELPLEVGALEPVALRCSQMLVQTGQTVTVELLARHGGSCIATGVTGRLRAPEALRIEAVTTAGSVRPGVDSVVASWRLTALRPTPLAWVEGGFGAAGETVRAPLTVASVLPVAPAGLANARTTAAVSGTTAVVGSQRTRLVLAKEETGWGVGVLQVNGAAGWQNAAVLPRLGLLAGDGADVPLCASQATAESVAGETRLRLSGRASAAGATWQIEWTLSAQADRDVIDYRITATPQGPAQLTAFEGPLLYAGEGTTETRRDAILPGLEWLVEGEESSNALDIRPDHPDCTRYVPHPYKVTIPAVGMTVGNTIVGLLWDAPTRQPSAEVAGLLNVLFATPNRFEGHRNHLLGLSLPAVGRGMAENARRAATPLALAAGQALEIRAGLLAQPAGSDGALAVVERWFADAGVPDPLPYPRGDARAEVAFSLQAYAKDLSLWNPDWKKWRTGLIAGGETTPTDAPAFELAFGAQFLADSPAAAAARALAAEVWGIEPGAVAARLQHRADPGAALAQAREARSLIARQHPDGTWRFSGEKAGEWPAQGVNYDVLGPVGASEVGLTARAATTVLEFALLSGDSEAKAAGLQALAGMRQFRVPRAAQVWEVPVHTPDILASAQAVDAYLAGYRLTRERALLQDAIYWAKTGLPFVYAWAPADLPAMQGATIPVFGATAYVLSWFAVAVQWNGLAYSDALFDLAEIDASFPWRKIAENVLRSAMYQQATEGDRLAQWPDALNFIPGRPGLHGQTPPCFRPVTILQQTWRTLGAPAVPRMTPVWQADDHLALRGTAAFAAAAWENDVLTFTATFAAPLRGAVEVFCLERPNAVLLEGREVAAAADVWTGAAPAWTWHEATGSVEIRLAEPGRQRVQVRGVRRTRPLFALPVRPSMDFDFAQDGTAGWVAQHDLAPLQIEAGMLQTRATGTDPYMLRDSLAVEGRAGDVLVLRLACSGGPQKGSVFWGTEQEPGASPKREIGFALDGTGDLEEVRVAVGAHAQWARHLITALRLDPGGLGEAVVRIASMRLARAAP